MMRIMQYTILGSLAAGIATSGSTIHAQNASAGFGLTRPIPPPAALFASPSPPKPAVASATVGARTRPTCPPRGDLDTWTTAHPGGIVGRAIEASDPNATLEGVQVTIPELRLSAVTCADGSFYFPYQPQPSEAIQYVSLRATATGYGVHTMVNVPFAKAAIGIVTLRLTLGAAPTRSSGALRASDVRRSQASARVPFQVTPLAAPSPGRYSNQTVPPPYTRIAIRENGLDGRPNPTGPIIRIDTVDFDYYIKNVLPNEWFYPGAITELEALKAGAMAIKNYAWYWVINNSKPGVDCDNSTNCQFYNPDYNSINTTGTNNAANAVVNSGWHQNGQIFQSFYIAGTAGSPRGCKSPIDGSLRNDCMTQYGSQYWAKQGKAYKWILSNYYTNITPTYYTIIPPRASTFATSVSTTSVRLSFSTPGATKYQLFKFVSGNWQQIYQGTGATFTDTNVAANQPYYYTARGGNFAGWGPWTYNDGIIKATAKAVSSVPTPRTELFFITDKEIRIRTTSTDVGVTKYAVYRSTGTSWTLAYNGPSNLYVDTSLSANTSYYYTVAAYNPSKGWSDYCNFNGYVRGATYPTY